MSSSSAILSTATILCSWATFSELPIRPSLGSYLNENENNSITYFCYLMWLAYSSWRSISLLKAFTPPCPTETWGPRLDRMVKIMICLFGKHKQHHEGLHPHGYDDHNCKPHSTVLAVMFALYRGSFGQQGQHCHHPLLDSFLLLKDLLNQLWYLKWMFDSLIAKSDFLFLLRCSPSLHLRLMWQVKSHHLSCLSHGPLTLGMELLLDIIPGTLRAWGERFYLNIFYDWLNSSM